MSADRTDRLGYRARVTLFIVRHASAGDRSTWIGDDLLRPLDQRGIAQSVAICRLIGPTRCTSLVSSPAVRCTQTLEPLAAETGLPVEIDDRLVEAAVFEPVLALLEDCADGTVVCSHGDVIPAVVDAMMRRGMVLLDEIRKVKKGSVFAVERESGRFVTARHWSRPGT